ncbi:hypothetical protein FYK17_15725 [Escherichia albertii]|nr:hypothetical protein FYK17_15725 [Escherichia albertii]
MREKIREGKRRTYRELYVRLCKCLLLMCSIQHQKQVAVWSKNSCRLWLSNLCQSVDVLRLPG